MCYSEVFFRGFCRNERNIFPFHYVHTYILLRKENDVELLCKMHDYHSKISVLLRQIQMQKWTWNRKSIYKQVTTDWLVHTEIPCLFVLKQHRRFFKKHNSTNQDAGQLGFYFPASKPRKASSIMEISLNITCTRYSSPMCCNNHGATHSRTHN
jgi:hypothetical protein